MKSHSLIALFLFALAACQNPTRPPNASQNADPAKISSDPKMDTSLTGIGRMLKYFRDSLGHIDPEAQIGRDFVIRVFNDTNMLWDGISSINPIQMTRNVHGTFFLVKLNCSAGGQCQNFYIVGYDSKNHLASPEHIGDFMADAGFEQTFGYRSAGDSAIVVTTKNYDGAETLKDSSVIRYPLAIRNDSLMMPQKRDTLIAPPKEETSP